MTQNRSKHSKLEIRKELVSLISKYKDTSLVKNTQIIADLDYLDAFEDKDYVLKFLFKEMLSDKASNANICALFILELFDKNTVEKLGIEFLTSKKVSDNKKFFLISVLKQKGIAIDYQDISGYIDNPDDIAKEGVRKFLQGIATDAEVQIDLLDFYSNIPDFEKVPLLRSVLDETDDDTAALVLSLIIQIAFSKEELLKEEYSIIYDKLLSLKSPYAIPGLEHILKNFEIDKKQTLLISGLIKELQFKNRNFKPNEITDNTKVYKSYISFIDGQSNFSLIFSRIDKERKFKTFLASCNLDKGIVSCMGFSKINEENFNAILSRLFADSMPVEISPIALKGILGYFANKNRETKTQIPYEFVVWKNLMSDVKDINYDIEEFIRSKLDTVNLDAKKVCKLAASKMLATWYYAKNENKTVDELINEVEKRHFESFEALEEYCSDFIDKYFMTDEIFIEKLQQRLLILAYVARLANLKMSSLCSYSLCFKSKYLKIIVLSIIDKSLYYYFISQLLLKSNENNIFRRKNDSKYTKDELNKLISGFEEKWNHKKEL